jgi:hypothetical protein
MLSHGEELILSKTLECFVISQVWDVVGVGILWIKYMKMKSKAKRSDLEKRIKELENVSLR